MKRNKVFDYKENLKAVGEYCKQLREYAQITRSDMVKIYCRCSVQNLYEFESGRNNSAIILAGYYMLGKHIGIDINKVIFGMCIYETPQIDKITCMVNHTDKFYDINNLPKKEEKFTVIPKTKKDNINIFDEDYL